MSKYIDADELKKLVEEEFKGVCVYDVSPDEAISDFCDVVDNCSSADVAPVVHGEWCGSVCSACGESTSYWYNCSYCPNCGAKMDESEGEQ